ncbi:MAG: hypothetical protein J6J35_08060 [Alphaproteobacteria bacterium]|nr:hypothetical protein [Alphaproteobacteria bacterium]
MKSCERGRSMIEMLGVLAIVGILSVGGIAGYSKAMQKIKRDKVVTQLSMLVMNIRSGFLNQTDYSGLSNKLLIEAGMAPSDMFDAKEPASQAEFKHALGGNVSVFQSLNAEGKKRAFEVYLEGLTSDECVVLVTTDWGMDNASGFQALYVGAGEVEEALMEDVNIPAVSRPENGIYTPGQHNDAVPLTISGGMGACACSAATCVVGFKYH